MFGWERWFSRWRGLLATDRPEPAQQAGRIVKVLRDVVLPAKVGLCLVVLYYFFSGSQASELTARSVAVDTLKKYTVVYLLCNFIGAIFLVMWQRLPPGLVQWLAFTMGLLDGLFMAGVTIFTGGFSSIAFWVFPGLIVLNALSIPLAMPQIVLNLLLSIFYMGAVLLTPQLSQGDMPTDSQLLADITSRTNTVTASVDSGTNRPVVSRAELIARIKHRLAVHPDVPFEDPTDETLTTNKLLLRASVLWLLTLCCYGTQLLLERQRHALVEAAEFAAREGQLHSAGRLAAEFAHQLKNPLTVINNAAFSLRRSIGRDKNAAEQQIEIIQEEVTRVDKVITQIMGYAQLSEGRVERLRVADEIERAVEQVFPAAVPMGVKFRKKLTGPFPPLLMQRNHLAEILVNLLQNAREAVGKDGSVTLTAWCNRDLSVIFQVADDGPGIAADKVERIFEAYFTTKEKGTGLGLAIVKHNAELYGGSVDLESELGKGAKFTVTLPEKSLPKANNQ